MRTQPGESCSLFIDLDTGDQVAPSDVIVSSGGTCYLVTEARRVRSTVRPNRWSMSCVRIAAAEIPADARQIPLHWYPRSRR